MKKALFVALILLLGMLFIGCGGGSSSSDGDNSDDNGGGDTNTTVYNHIVTVSDQTMTVVLAEDANGIIQHLVSGGVEYEVPVSDIVSITWNGFGCGTTTTATFQDNVTTINLPYPSDTGQMIVTDVNGNIYYLNKDFITLSGATTDGNSIITYGDGTSPTCGGGDTNTTVYNHIVTVSDQTMTVVLAENTEGVIQHLVSDGVEYEVPVSDIVSITWNGFGCGTTTTVTFQDNVTTINLPYPSDTGQVIVTDTAGNKYLNKDFVILSGASWTNDWNIFYGDGTSPSCN